MEVRRSFSIVALLFASACSGATSTELFDPVSQEGSPAAPIVGMNDDGDAPGASSGNGGSTGGSTLPGTTNDAGASPDADAGTPPPAPGTCLSEKEPNDGPEMTEWFTECFSGSVKRGDIDYASISAPATATRIKIEHQESGGDVRYRLYINGLQYGSFSDDAPDLIPVFAGGTYSFEMSPMGSNNGARNYELKVTFE